MKVYIAGPMRGYPEFNFPSFFAAASAFEKQGYAVVNPAQMDLDNPLPPDSHREYARRDCAALLDCDMIYMLRGWERSIGARAEHAVAVWAGLNPVYQE